MADPAGSPQWVWTSWDSFAGYLPASSGIRHCWATAVYAKLPAWFKIETPLGTYNPDWAVVSEIDGQERLYFVVETKGSLFSGDLRAREKAKIDCGREHFKALDTEIVFAVANDYDKFTQQAIQ